MQASNKTIDIYHMKMLELLLLDPKVKEAIKIDGKQINRFDLREDGTAIFGVFKWGWINRLFNSYYQIGFLEVVQRIAYVLTNNGNTGNDLMEFIRESIDKVIKKDEKEKVIELLLQYAMMLSENSVLKLQYNSSKDSPEPKKTDKIRNIHGRGLGGIDLGGEILPIELLVTVE